MKFNLIKNIKVAWVLCVFFLLPIIASAQIDVTGGFGNNTPKSFTGIICKLKELVIYTVPFLVALAVIFFLIGLLKYVGNGDNEEKRTEGTKLMVYGVFGLFVIVAVWSLVAIVTGTFGLEIGIPQFKGNEGLSTGC